MNNIVYTAAQAAEAAGISLHTLRYYLKIGLLPFVNRTSGQRRYTPADIDWLKQLQTLKRTGLSLKDIRRYVAWVEAGDATLPQRAALFENQRQHLAAQIAQLQSDLALVEQKCQLYRHALTQPDSACNFTAQCTRLPPHTSAGQKST